MHPCFEFREYLYDKDLQRIDGNDEAPNTKRNNRFYIRCHQFDIINTKVFGTIEQFNGQPITIPYVPRFYIDINTPDDVDLAYAAWDGGLENMKNIVRRMYAEHRHSWKCSD